MFQTDTYRPARWVIGITGASGVRYALRLLEVMAELGVEIHLIFSDAALRVLKDEEGIATSPARLNAKNLIGRDYDKFFVYNNKDIGALPASGSALLDGMVIVPCSMGTLGAIASGACQNLIHRAADVTLKEGRKLIMVPRETPLSAIHLENMLKLSKLGVRMLAAMPGFYQMPKSIADLVDSLVMKIADQMGLNCELLPRWTGSTVKIEKFPEVKKVNIPAAKA